MNISRPKNGWSPDKNLWENLKDVADSLEWRKVRFLRKNEVRVPKQSGVYFISIASKLKISSTINTVIYVGQSKSSIRSRFKDHIASNKLRPYLDCFYPDSQFWFAYINDEEKINEMEVLLINAFNPPCNSIQAPGTKPILARLGKSKIIGQT